MLTVSETHWSRRTRRVRAVSECYEKTNAAKPDECTCWGFGPSPISSSRKHERNNGKRKDEDADGHRTDPCERKEPECYSPFS
jgi:hypothetical protein